MCPAKLPGKAVRVPENVKAKKKNLLSNAAAILGESTVEVVTAKRLTKVSTKTIQQLEEIYEVINKKRELRNYIMHSYLANVNGTLNTSIEISELEKLSEEGRELIKRQIAIENVLSGETKLRIELEEMGKTVYPRLSVIGIMRKKSAQQTTKAFWLLVIAIIVHIIFSIVTKSTADTGVLLVPAFFIALLFIETFVVNYRIRHGLYGTNEREAREIIRFIIRESENIDFTDGGKPKKIISEEDLESVKAIESIPDAILHGALS